MAGEPILSRLAAWSTFVVFPSAVIAYALSTPDANKSKTTPDSTTEKTKDDA